jgi:hypothetical protein
VIVNLHFGTKKKNMFELHLTSELCIIIRRPPPRWAKWSRGVRTRGLRVGLVGGPRPLFFLGSGFPPKILLPVDFDAKWLNIALGNKAPGRLAKVQ